MTAAVAELARVNGRHRNRALAASRRVRAVELKAAGLTYEQIAAELGYANRGTVYRIVSEALKAQTVEGVDQLRSLEVERLDQLQLGCGRRRWPAMFTQGRSLFASSWPDAACWVYSTARVCLRPGSSIQDRGRPAGDLTLRLRCLPGVAVGRVVVADRVRLRPPA